MLPKFAIGDGQYHIRTILSSNAKAGLELLCFVIVISVNFYLVISNEK